MDHGRHDLVEDATVGLAETTVEVCADRLDQVCITA